MPLQAQPSPLSSDYLIIGEGGGDASFAQNLCEARGIQGFQFEDARGNANFNNRLKGLTDRTGFDRLKGVLIISDNDDTPDANFAKIRGSLKGAKLPHADAPLKVARHNKDSVAIVVMMLPLPADGKSRKGCLETVLLQSVEASHPAIAQCVDDYRACIAGHRSKNEEDKFRMRCFISALHPEDPNLSISWATSPAKGVVDLRDECFDELANFLDKFSEYCRPK